MPTYDYQCRACAQVIEVIHPMTADGPSTCEACGGELRRVLYPAGIIFKGSGFYRTDSRANGGGGAKAPASSATSTSATDSTGGGSGEASPKATPSDSSKKDTGTSGSSAP